MAKAKKNERNVFIQTVTHYYTGRVVAEYESEIVLDNAAWIADCGRFADFLATSNASEVEPLPSDMHVAIQRGAIVAVYEWPHRLPREQK